MTKTITMVDISSIALSETESQKMRRESFDKKHLEELTDSIASQGVLQPLILRPNPDGRAKQRYELVAGERRLLASRAAKLAEVPAIVSELTDDKVIEVQLVENLQREGLHPMQEAEGYAALRAHGKAPEEIAEMVGKSRSYVYGRMKLIDLSPACRKAFYAGQVSESIALLLARMPTSALQNQALDVVRERDGYPVSFRRAREVIDSNFMLRLAEAPFKTGEADLVPGVPSCRDCPKRTGNQPELFGDVKGADICTDPTCFGLKKKAAGDRQIAEAKEAGVEVLTQAEAGRVLQYGTRSPQGGYARLDDSKWVNGKNVRVDKLVGKDAPVVLAQDKAGEVVRLVAPEVLNRALKEKGGPAAGSSRDDGTKARQRKAAIESKFRQALYQVVREKVAVSAAVGPYRASGTLIRALVAVAWKHMWHEHRTLIQKTCGWGDKLEVERDGNVAKLSAQAVRMLAHDLIFVDELKVSPWGGEGKPVRLLSAAKNLRIDAGKVRAACAPKKRKAKAKAKGGN